MALIVWIVVFWATFIAGFFKHWLWYITAAVFLGPTAGLVIWGEIERLVMKRRLHKPRR